MTIARKTLGMLCVLAAMGAVRADTTLPTWKDELPDPLKPENAGDVLGTRENPLAQLLLCAQAAEVQALAAIGGTKGVVTPEERAEVRLWLTRSRGVLVQIDNELTGPGELQAGTLAKEALAQIRFARVIDDERDSELGNAQEAVKRKPLARAIGRAIEAKGQALLHLQALHTSRRDRRGAYVVPTTPEQRQAFLVFLAYTWTRTFPSQARTFEELGAEMLTWMGRSMAAYRFEGLADRNLVRFRGCLFDGKGGLRSRVATDQRRPGTTRRSPGKAAPRNHVLAFSAQKGKTDAYGFYNLQREIRGPFSYSFTAGNFEKAPKNATYLASQSFVGVEMDVKGSSPLEFFSIGTQYTVADPQGTTKGIQVFANSRGTPRGSMFLAGVQAVDVYVEFQMGVYRAYVKPAGGPPEDYVLFATYDRGNADEVWTGGIGGANFSGARTLGVDDLVFEALPKFQ